MTTEPAGDQKREMAGKSTYFAFNDLLHGARSLLKTASEQKEGSAYCRILALVLLAFATEAALNHIGEDTIPEWDAPGLRLWKDKLEGIGKHFAFDVSLGKAPLQFLVQLFHFRDRLAHSRTTETTVKCEAGEEWDALDPAWRKKVASTEYLEAVLPKVEKAIRYLLDKTGYQELSLNKIGDGMFWSAGDEAD